MIIANIDEHKAYAENILYLSIFLLLNLNSHKSISFVLRLPKEIR